MQQSSMTSEQKTCKLAYKTCSRSFPPPQSMRKIIRFQYKLVNKDLIFKIIFGPHGI